MSAGPCLETCSPAAACPVLGHCRGGEGTPPSRAGLALELVRASPPPGGGGGVYFRRWLRTWLGATPAGEFAGKDQAPSIQEEQHWANRGLVPPRTATLASGLQPFGSSCVTPAAKGP